MEWRIIPGFEAYEVSEYGEVRRCIPDVYGRPMRQLTPHFHKFGYPLYTLTVAGKTKKMAAHQLVALAFLGPKPFPRAEVTHKERDPLNNHYSNLKWATHYGNMQDAKRHGTTLRGEKNHTTKIADTLAKEICIEYQSENIPLEYIAKKYGVAISTIARIVRGKRYITGTTPARNAGIRHGTRHHNAKLSESDICAIRRLYASEQMTQAQIAQKYHVAQSAISKIVRGNRWAHEKGPIVNVARLGESNKRAKLTATDVVNIRMRYAAEGISQQALSRQYGVSRSLIGLIVTGKRWAHLEAHNP